MTRPKRVKVKKGYWAMMYKKDFCSTNGQLFIYDLKRNAKESIWDAGQVIRKVRLTLIPPKKRKRV